VSEEAKARLHLDIPVTLYQAQNSPQLKRRAFLSSARKATSFFFGPLLTAA